MTVSEAYADLGGLTAPPPRRPRPRSRYESTAVDYSPGRVCERHMFDPTSGWCSCGTRDDGEIADGSPAWRAAVEHTMPDPDKEPS